MRRVFRPFPWALFGHLCLGIVLAPLLAITLGLAALALPLAVFTPWPFLAITRNFAALTALDRARFHVLQRRQVGQELPSPPADLSRHARVPWVLAEPRHQAAAGYAVVRLGLAGLQLAVLTLVFTVPLVYGVSTLLGVLTPYRPRGLYLFSWVPLDPELVLVALALGVALFVVVIAPALIRGLAWVDAWITLTLLGAAKSGELERRVGELVEARARTVSAADAERAKLERDLHDGAQQRLIALSVLLGQAEARLADADDATRGVVRRARAETAGTIDELRTLTRGLRPPILEARGLDAALSAVASRLPMPVVIDVDLDNRPDPALEAMLYFAVTELLTNVAKHAEGAAASVDVARAGKTLRATVTDGGPGGADVARGTGLGGIADRLAGVDGRLFLASPPGGPTVVTVEVPCA